MSNQERADENRHRVLVVDDDTLILDAVEAYLRTYGFDVERAAEREEAEALLSTRAYSLVISDLRMTGVHGREGLEVVRVAREKCPLARVIVMTGYGTPELELEVRQHGCDLLLEKPIPLSELVMAARELLGDRPPAAFEVTA